MEGRAVAWPAGVLLEPTTVVTKASEQVQANQPTCLIEGRKVLVTGAGTIDLCWRRWFASRTRFEVRVLIGSVGLGQPDGPTHDRHLRRGDGAPNNVIVGSVNATSDTGQAGQALTQAGPVAGTSGVAAQRPEAFMNALHRQPDDIKVVIQFAGA